ncbi:MAG: c-type cytochrome [Bacteroidetes bacterium]|nr:c-type cytochrome [Bacteroidota bacterium]MBS1932272.1 c-type cytochrome [Bacteroidota bacterium]
MSAFRTSWFPFFLAAIFFIAILNNIFYSPKKDPEKKLVIEKDWKAPDINLVPQTPEGDLIRYGRALIVNTSKYLGPRGIVAPITNGMNCQNCHIEAGMRLPVNSFFSVASTYPRFRERSGKVESIVFRINDCLQRSLDGKTIDSLSKEMQAMVAYLKWVGKNGIPKEKLSLTPAELPFLNRAADTLKGKIIFQENCQRCHQSNGQGVLYPDSTGYLYPPLWGVNSFNASAGLYRISRLAIFIKYNMPFDQVKNGPKLSEEDAWDVAAFICSKPRPVKIFPEDWPNPESKPIDFPFGPYTDGFTLLQHKYGPFLPIKKAHSAIQKASDHH